MSTKCTSIKNKVSYTQIKDIIQRNGEENKSDDKAMKDALSIQIKKKARSGSATDILNQKATDIMPFKPNSKIFSKNISNLNEVIKPKLFKSNYDCLIDNKNLSINTQNEDLISDLL